jgi:hypothetical protein
MERERVGDFARTLVGRMELLMRPTRLFWITVVMIATLVACDSVELTIAVSPADEGWLEVSNANDATWKDAVLVIEKFESEGSTSPCGEELVAHWEPGQTVRVPACAEKVRFTLTTGGKTARFSYFNGQLYRRLGRREIPIAR